MFQLDEKFLQDLGLDQLPEQQRQAFLQHIYEELEMRVGTKLSDGLSEQQLEEFEAIIDKKEEVIANWISANAPNYQQDDVFQKLQASTGMDANDPGLRDEFVATKWLEMNRSDYRDVVAQTLDELKAEIRENKDAILGGGQ